MGKYDIIKFVKTKSNLIGEVWTHVYNTDSLTSRDFDELWTQEFVSGGILHKKRIRLVRYSGMQAPLVEVQITEIKKTKMKIPKWAVDFVTNPDGYVWSVSSTPFRENVTMPYMEAIKKYILQ